MYYPSDGKRLRATIQAPFVLAEIRAIRSSVFKSSPEVQRSVALAEKVERAYDLTRADLFIPALETYCALLEPFDGTLLTGTMRRVGYEMFPQYINILGIPANGVKAAMNIKSAADLVRTICGAYSTCVLGEDAGALAPEPHGSGMVVTDTSFMPCQLQMGVFLGAGKLTGLLREGMLIERRCRGKGDKACVYEFAL